MENGQNIGQNMGQNMGQKVSVKIYGLEVDPILYP